MSPFYVESDRKARPGDLGKESIPSLILIPPQERDSL